MEQDGNAIVADTCGEAWEQSIRLLLEGERVERYLSAEGPCWELSNLIMSIRHPLDEPRISTAYDFGDEFVDYICDLTLRRSRGVESVYDRLYRWKSGRSRIDQIAAVVKTLKSEPTSRRAIATIWDPAIDLAAPHPMCLASVGFRRKSTGLHMTVLLRSNDAWFATPADIKAFTELQRLVADELGAPVGTYTHHSISYHIYDYDVPRASRILGSRQRELFTPHR